MVREIYVADSDEQAWAEAGIQVTRFWQLATDNVWSHEPISTDDLTRYTARFAYFPGGLTTERLDEWGVSLIGSHETVTRKARAMLDAAQPDALIGMFSFGGLTHQQVTHSIELFAAHVMPALAPDAVSASR